MHFRNSTLTLLAILVLLGGSARADSFLALGGHMYGVAGDQRPSPGFQAVVDSLASYPLDAYIAAGDCTNNGLAAEWDSLEATYSGKWSFPFVPVLGNHDSRDMLEWYSRWGDDTWRDDYGSTRVLFLWTSQYPNQNMDQEHLDFVVQELALAATDPTVTDILVVQHHLAWIKMHERYELAWILGNGWYDEFSGRGYDVNAFFDEIWPSVVAAGQAKPTTLYCGDSGYTDITPGIFYDVLDGVTLIASGYNAHGAAQNDAVVFYRSVGGVPQYELYSPWGVDLGALEDYDLAYWNARLAPGSNPPSPGVDGKGPPYVSAVPGGNYDMGDHIDPRFEGYTQDTGYTVTLSPFHLTVTEVTVEQYLQFLNAEGNYYEGLECVDLNDAQVQVEENAGVFAAKDISYLSQPIVEVSWYGALAFCNWRSVQDGLDPAYTGSVFDPLANGWRLPTDAEFEFAHRGGYGTDPSEPIYNRFWWGNDVEGQVHDFANYHGTGGVDVWEGLAPVGSFPSNAYGLKDMAGNAFEWTYDPYTFPYDLAGNVQDPVAPGYPWFQEFRVIRGGGYNYHWAGCRTGYRGGEMRQGSQSYIGFRMAHNSSSVAVGGPEVVRIVPNPMLLPAVPNPFNPRTTLRFELPLGARDASLHIYDARGRLIRTLFSTLPSNTSGEWVWDGRGDDGSEVASGSYLAVLRSEGQQSTQKLALIR